MPDKGDRSMSEKNAVIYARYSSDNQTEQSIEGQLRDCHAYAERQGLKVVREYIDRAISGRRDDRPAFQEMLRDAGTGTFSVVLVWKLDRFARSKYTSAVAKHDLASHGVKVLSAMEGISDTPEGIIMEAVLEASAEYYSANLAQNVIRGLRLTAEKTGMAGGATPYGFRRQDGKLLEDPQTAPIVQRIFREYAGGKGVRDIAEDLNLDGIKSPQGREWNRSSFYRILKSEAYLGNLIVAGKAVGNYRMNGGCPALVDRETWERCQEITATNRGAPAHRKGREEYLLSGKLFCGDCGEPMVGGCGLRYICRNRIRQNPACKGKSKKKDQLEAQVVRMISEHVLSPAHRDHIARCIVEAYTGGGERRSDLRRQIAALDREADAIVDKMLRTDAQIILDRLTARAKEIEITRQALSVELARTDREKRPTLREARAWLEGICSGQVDSQAYNRSIIQRLVRCIYLFRDSMVIYVNAGAGSPVWLEEAQEARALYMACNANINATVYKAPKGRLCVMDTI